MTPRLLPSLAAALVACADFGTVASTASAQGPLAPPSVVHLAYEAEADCPTAAEFIGKLVARRRDVQVRADVESDRTIVIRVHPAGNGKSAHGELIVRYADGAPSERTVDGDNCASVVDALALMSALALEPSEGNSAIAPLKEPPPPSENSSLEDPGAYHIAAFADASAAWGLAPVLVPDVTGAAEIGRPHPGRWAFDVRAGFAFARSESANVLGGALQTTRAAATLDACPLRWTSGPFRLSPCLFVEAGTFAVAGEGIAPARESVRPWVALGARGAARVNFQRRFFLEGAAGVRAPLVRDSFYFETDPAATLFRPPPIAGFLGGALGVTIL